MFLTRSFDSSLTTSLKPIPTAIAKASITPPKITKKLCSTIETSIPISFKEMIAPKKTIANLALKPTYLLLWL